MVDQLLYRLNRVPDRHYVKFLELIGVQLLPADRRARRRHVLAVGAAAGDGRGAAPGPRSPRRGPRSTRRSSSPPSRTCRSCPARSSDVGRRHGRRRDRPTTPGCCAEGSDVPAASRPPRRPATRCCSGCRRPSRRARCVLRLDCRVERRRRRPAQPAAGLGGVERRRAGAPARSTATSTGGLNRAGDVVLHVPATHAQSVDRAAARRLAALPGAAPGRRDPRVHAQPADLRACRRSRSAAPPSRARRDRPRRGRSASPTASPGQRFPLQRGPVVPWTEASVLQVPTGCAGADVVGAGARLRRLAGPTTGTSGSTRWRRGLVRARGPRGRRGAAPVRRGAAARARLRLSAYRTGGGRRGNVAARRDPGAQVDVPYVARVENRHRPPAGWTARHREREGARAAAAAGARPGGDRRGLRGPGPRRRPGRGAGGLPAGHVRRCGGGRHRRAAGGGAAAGRAPGGDRRPGRIAFDELRTPPRELLRRISDYLTSAGSSAPGWSWSRRSTRA